MSHLEEREKTKASLKAWWSAFAKVRTHSKEKKSPIVEETKVFGVPLRKSLKYASVAISMAGDDGSQYVWGYVPVVVAKVGLYLKENAVEIEGVFRIAGSQKRMRELQEVFDTPPKYGKDVDWSKYSVHDAASVLRRYLNQMPEPIIPLHLYNEFRNIMTKEPFDVNAAIRTYRLMITSSPPANQYLLLYVLDLLAVFARASDKNLMPASNLAMIFQPGMFSHPAHLNSANEHKLAVQVLEFLIEHQDHFVLGLSQPPPANISPAQLTAVSHPVNPDEVYFEPSDSDEDLGTLEAHEGGGAKLARKATKPSSPTSAAGSSSGKRKQLLKKAGLTRGAADMAISKTAQDPLQRAENVKLSSQVISPRGLSLHSPVSGPSSLTSGLQPERVSGEAGSSSRSRASVGTGREAVSPPQVALALPADDSSFGLGRTGSNIRRSKTTPTRRPEAPGALPRDGSSASGRPDILERTSSRRRRKSHDTGSPSGSPLVTPGG